MKSPLMLVAHLLVLPALATAAPPPVACESLTNGELLDRIEYIEKEMAEHEAAHERWFFGYGGLFMALTTYMAVRVNTSDSDQTKQTSAVSIVGNILGLATTVLREPSILTVQEKLDAYPENDRAQLIDKVEFAEAQYKQASRQVDKNKSWLTRLTAGAWSVASSLFVLLVIEDKVGALTQAIGGLLIGQSRPILYPEGIRESYNSYRRERGTCLADTSVLRPQTEPAALSFIPNPTGFTIRF